VCSVANLLGHDYTVGRGVMVELEDADMGSVPAHNIVPRFSETPGAFSRPAPRLGEHTDEVLSEIGRSRTAERQG
jgi:crotonobetainyl-CoA:carnitine CoA-transferase CaiB-like acyl-CoA transferase